MKKLITTFLTFVMVFSLFAIPTSAYSTKGVEGFVARCYDIALGREPDDESLKGWCDQLRSGDACGVSVAFGFVYSPEFQNAGYNNADYVEKMYNMLLGRPSDEGGKAYWVQQLDAGVNREEIFSGFANSQEFFDLCDSYGIFAGHYIPNVGMQRNADINGFVDRLYRICLGRHGDMGSQAGFVEQLYTGANNGSAVAFNFVFSNEYQNSLTSISSYICTLYEAFLGRKPAEEEVDAWIDKAMDSNYTLLHIFDRFANSAEFDAICAKYGIIRGTSGYGNYVSPTLPSNIGPALSLIINNYEALYSGVTYSYPEPIEFFDSAFTDRYFDSDMGWYYKIGDNPLLDYGVYDNNAHTIAFCFTTAPSDKTEFYYEIYRIDTGYQLLTSGSKTSTNYTDGTLIDFSYTSDSCIPTGQYLVVVTNTTKSVVFCTAKCWVID